MKKLYFFLVAMLVAFAANAASSQLWLFGELGGGWDSQKGTVMTQTEVGVFTVDYAAASNGDKYFAFVDKLDSKWDVVNAHRYAPAENDTEVVLGTEMAMEYGKDASWKISVEKGKTYHFVVNTNTKKFTVTEGASVEIPPFAGGVLYFEKPSTWAAAKIYVYPEVAKWPGVDMTLVEGSIYSYDVPANTEIVVFNEGKNGGQQTDNIEGANIVAGDLYKADCSHAKYVPGTTPDPDPTPDPTPDPETITVALRGVPSWDAEVAYSTTEIKDNCATIVVENWACEGGFKFTVNGNWFGEKKELVNGTWYDYIKNGAEGDNLTLPAEANGKTVTFTVAIDNYNASDPCINVQAKWAAATETTYQAYCISILCDGKDEANALGDIMVFADEEDAEEMGMENVLVDGVATFVVENWGDFYGDTYNKFAISAIDNVSGMMNGTATIDTYSTEATLVKNTPVTLAKCATPVYMSLPESANGKTVTIAYNVANKSLTATWAADYVVYIATSANEFNLATCANKTTVVEENKATIVVNNWNAEWQFKPVVTVDGNATWYGANQGDNVVVTLSESANKNWFDATVAGGFGNNFKLPTEANSQKVTFVVAVDNGHFNVDWSTESGIEAVEAENAGEAVYYNLQGVQVANPTNGVYVRVQGGKAAKVLVK